MLCTSKVLTDCFTTVGEEVEGVREGMALCCSGKAGGRKGGRGRD